MDKRYEDEVMKRLDGVIIERLCGSGKGDEDTRKLLREVYERGKIDGEPEYVEGYGYVRDS